MNKEDFDKLDAPLADHILQVMVYRKLYQIMGYRVFPYVHLLYVRKDFLWRSGKAIYKEYRVDAAAWGGRVGALLARGELIHRKNKAGALPDRTLCDNIRSPRAKSCPRAALCFSL